MAAKVCVNLVTRRGVCRVLYSSLSLLRPSAKRSGSSFRLTASEKWKAKSVDALLAIGLFARLMWNVPDAELRRIYRRRMATMLRRRLDPSVMFVCVLKCVTHYHHYTMSRQMGEQRSPVNTF